MSKRINQNYHDDSDEDRPDYKNKSSKPLKPIIQDDRRQTRPNYISREELRNNKDQRSQYRQDNPKYDSKPYRDQRTYDRTEEYDRSYDQRAEKYPKNKGRELKSQKQRPFNRSGYNKNYRIQFQRDNYIITKKLMPAEEIQNYVYVGRKSDLKDLYAEVKQKLPKFNFVGIKATSSQIIRAIKLAEDLAKDYPNLHRVNIPGIVQLAKIYTPKPNRSGLKQYVKVIRKATILVEVSLKTLSARHMGYQEPLRNQQYNTNYNRANRKRRANQNRKKSLEHHQSKQQDNPINKSQKYTEKESYKFNQREEQSRDQQKERKAQSRRGPRQGQQRRNAEIDHHSRDQRNRRQDWDRREYKKLEAKKNREQRRQKQRQYLGQIKDQRQTEHSGTRHESDKREWISSNYRDDNNDKYFRNEREYQGKSYK